MSSKKATFGSHLTMWKCYIDARQVDEYLIRWIILGYQSLWKSFDIISEIKLSANNVWKSDLWTLKRNVQIFFLIYATQKIVTYPGDLGHGC